MPMPFRLAYFGIRVKNMEESIRFYTEVLGMRVVEPVEVTPLTNGKVATLQSHDSNQLLELNWYEPGTRFGLPYSNGEDLDHLAFDCEDLEKAIAGLQARGVEVIVRLKEIEGWNEAFIQDPNGIWIELLQRKR